MEIISKNTFREYNNILVDYCFYNILHLSVSCMHPFDNGSFMYMLDHAEPETKGPTEQVPTEDANLELSQGKPRCIQPNNP
jgi:hypothetical protein